MVVEKKAFLVMKDIRWFRRMEFEDGYKKLPKICAKLFRPFGL